ncbi:MAG TPA: hypothetical protein VMU60_12705 [Syntrophobacteria bacterium]|nr:hypothetical protein [Syntrophobacteria bacterium]
MTTNRINSCSSFRDGTCRHRRSMERLYLIPQLLKPRTRARYERTCSRCGCYVEWCLDPTALYSSDSRRLSA